ncbi:hypothetical protein IMSAG249_00324 [Lachnospiraceae bacterium]|jgi:Protein of unknown function (DUF1565).|nr:hypothetical protein IMSAGC009_00910 [Lachnospiraceae bacterium]GFI68507.1 hypothetical protein IMSAG249_00324 [Lachnospiraceae bacterium]
MIIYVDRNAGRSGDGTKHSPYQTISEAAFVARPGDEVLVAPGIYLKYVDPPCVGEPEKRIIYRSEVNGGAIQR